MSCCHEEKEKPAPLAPLPSPLSKPTFHPFPRLIPEIRAKIWALALPPHRVLHVSLNPISLNSPAYASDDSFYTTSPYSYGGAHPAILSVNRESRAEALRHLVLKFKAYWNLKRDTLYIDVKRWGAQEAADMLWNMTSKGLLDGIRNLAFDTAMVYTGWPQGWGPEHCMKSLRSLPNLNTCALIMRRRTEHKDVLTPGQAWTLLPIDSPDQTEYPSHESWCPQVQRMGKILSEFLQGDVVVHEKEWSARGPGPNMGFFVIEGRAMESMPFSPRFYEPPGMDFFG